MAQAEASGVSLILTTAQLERDLKEIEHLIAGLRRTGHKDIGDFDDLNWLQSRRRYVLAVLASRRAQRGKKVVRLDLWRTGGVAVAEAIANVA